ncbi:ATP-binding protein [Hydrogenimonas urashimensis]|uniref:ATP-binding protein n=1 Tax=Hydrogenimonas urashimensis TaxID=2740515 RepID=UPI00191652AB|nr:ATP-binding protein [Hydrogenimonas urashimensis]
MNELLASVVPYSLKNKLRIALFLIGIIPFIFILLYLHNLGRQKILDDTLAVQHAQMRLVKKTIEQHLVSLEKELRFLASLEIMNDIVVDDVDKRIAGLLSQKKRDLGDKVDLFALNEHMTTVASTTPRAHPFPYAKPMQKALRRKKNHFYEGKFLIFFTPVKTSLQKEKPLGYLVLRYDLQDLKRFTLKQRGLQTIFYFPQNGLQIAENSLSLKWKPKSCGKDRITEKYLVLCEHFGGPLGAGVIVNVVDKVTALSFLDHFIRFLWILFSIGFGLIAIFSWWVGERILKPVEKLTDATRHIVQTRDYGTRVDVESRDEIAQLARHFNVMVAETQRTLRMLEEESRQRLLRFVQLIAFFNKIIRTENEQACIETALEELGKLMPTKRFFFTWKDPEKEEATINLPLYVKDFEKGGNVLYGVIVLRDQADGIDVHEMEFYRSVAKMIMLQLDQIRLIKGIKAVSLAKSTFISHMSHELRTPLHTILSATQYLIGYEGLSASQQDRVSTIEAAAGHLLGMINDILDLVQIEAGKVPVNKKEYTCGEIAKVVEEAIEMLRVLAEEKELALTFQNRLQKEQKVVADVDLLKQILINLLSNAIKFTEKGRVEVVLRLCGTHCCIEISDTGVGLSQEEIAALFEEFGRVEKGVEGNQKGSGLGLAISRKLARLFGGDIEIHSEGAGKGVTAVLSIPVSK